MLSYSIFHNLKRQEFPFPFYKEMLHKVQDLRACHRFSVSLQEVNKRNNLSISHAWKTNSLLYTANVEIASLVAQWWRVHLQCRRLAGNTGSVPGLGRSPGEENDSPLPGIITWEIPWTEEPGGLQSMGSQKSQTRLKQLSMHMHKIFNKYICWRK